MLRVKADILRWVQRLCSSKARVVQHPAGSPHVTTARFSRSKIGDDMMGLFLATALAVPLFAISNNKLSVGCPPCSCDSSDKAWADAPGRSDEALRCDLSWVKGGLSTEAGCWLRQARSSCAREEETAEPRNAGSMFNPVRSRFFEIKLASLTVANPVDDEPAANKSIDSMASSMEGRSLSTVTKTTLDSAAIDKQEPLLHNTVVVLPGLLTEKECESIVLDAERIVLEKKGKGVKTEKWATFSLLKPECQKIIDRLLREHVLSFIELRLPDVAHRLFHRNQKPGTNDGDQCRSRKPVPTGMPMDFYWDDPVVIKYTAGNRLAPHEDMRDLTIVITLNPLGDFPLDGGGTRFWLEGTAPEVAKGDDGVSICPPAGSGIMFNGDITHSGNSVYEGTRFVLMTSINLDE